MKRNDMNKQIRTIITAAAAILLLSACAGSHRPTTPAPPAHPEHFAPDIITVNHQTFTDEITTYAGPAIVVFYNNEFWQSLDMKRRIEWLAGKYKGQAKFALFHWPLSDDPSRFTLEMLPTVILYKNGNEIDRIKGIPPDEKERARWNDDIELWFLKNALQLKGSDYSADYTYFFRNDYKLQIGNY
jgi:hypothetical protein